MVLQQQQQRRLWDGNTAGATTTTNVAATTSTTPQTTANNNKLETDNVADVEASVRLLQHKEQHATCRILFTIIHFINIHKYKSYTKVIHTEELSVKWPPIKANLSFF